MGEFERHCDFHPLAGASWHCADCARDFCDGCVDDTMGPPGLPRCFLCGAELRSLGARHTATPFWRRLDACFRYALSGDALIVICATALLMSLVTVEPLAAAIALPLLGAFLLLRYAFGCLESTALGAMRAPHFDHGPSEWHWATLLLFGFLYLVVFVAGPGYFLLGGTIWTLVNFPIVALLPLLLITMGLRGSGGERNPAVLALRVLRAVGLRYGLLVLLLAVLVACLDILQALVGNASYLAGLVQILLGNYYLLVMFHLMGYVVFQYQHELGFAAREARARRDQEAIFAARLYVLVCAGRYAEARTQLAEAVQANPGDASLARRYFDYLVATRDAASLEAFAEPFLQRSMHGHSAVPITHQFLRVREILPRFLPEARELRLFLAEEFRKRGQEPLAAQLSRGPAPEAAGHAGPT